MADGPGEIVVVTLPSLEGRTSAEVALQIGRDPGRASMRFYWGPEDARGKPTAFLVPPAAQAGVEDETGMARNRAAFDAVTFRPRVLRGVARIDTGAELFGKPLPFPLILAPTGAAGLMWHRGDLALARAAASAGVPFTISSASTMDLEPQIRRGTAPGCALLV